MAKTPRHKPYWIDRGWQPAHIAFVPSKKAWDRLMKDVKEDDEYPTSNGRCYKLGATEYHHSLILVTIGEGMKSPADIVAVLVHESVHVYQFVKEFMGETTQPGMETEAYAVHAIASMLIQAFEETRFPLIRRSK